jgi:hypothetical protein
MLSVNVNNTDTTLTDQQLDRHHDLVVRELCSHDPSKAPICALCKTESHRFKECPLLNDDAFLRGFAVRMCTTVLKELRTAKHCLANPTESQIHAIEAHIHSILQDLPFPAPAPSVFPPGET